MDFELNDDQRQLKEAIAGFLAGEFPFERLKSLKRSGGAHDERLWRGLVELGVPALLVPTAAGGLGYGPIETLALMEAAGPHLLLEPVFASAILATLVLRHLGGNERLLGELARGERIATLAHFERDSRFELGAVATRAERTAEGWRLSGQKSLVLQAGLADVLLVSARLAEGRSDAGGMALFTVPRTQAGVRLEEYTLVDGQRASEVELEAVSLPPAACVGTAERVPHALELAVGEASAALGAEAVALMQALLGATIEYLRTRQQFGQPIGRFQALQHRVADMRVQLEQARSMSLLAAMRCRSEVAAERRRALWGAKALIGEASRFVGQQAVQLHGGMGMTDELQVGHWFKRLTAIDLWFGDSDAHLERYIDLMREAESADV